VKVSARLFLLPSGYVVMATPRTRTRNTGWVRLPKTYSMFIGKHRPVI